MSSKAKYIPPQLRGRGFSLASGLALLACLVGMAWLFLRVLVDFQYVWEWRVIPQFLFTWDESGEFCLGTLGQGFVLTLRLSLWASALGLVMGLALALGRLSRILYFRLISRTAVEICRNIPPLVLVFIGFYFLSAHLLPWGRLVDLIRQASPAVQMLVEFASIKINDLEVFFPAVTALALYEAAYFAEIFRGAVTAMDRGQWESSWCLGLGRFQQYRFIILPQVFRKTAPQLAGQFISTVKESSIVSVISLADLTFSGQQLSATIHRLFEVWLTVAALYFIFNFALSSVFQRMEH